MKEGGAIGAVARIWRLSILVAWLPALAYMALIFFISSLSHPPFPRGVPDAAYHIPEYMVLGLLMVRALHRVLHARASLLVALAGALLTFLYGVTDELHQSFVPGRAAEFHDGLSDALGALLAAGTWWGCMRLRSARRNAELSTSRR